MWTSWILHTGETAQGVGLYCNRPQYCPSDIYALRIHMVREVAAGRTTPRDQKIPWWRVGAMTLMPTPGVRIVCPCEGGCPTFQCTTCKVGVVGRCFGLPVGRGLCSDGCVGACRSCNHLPDIVNGRCMTCAGITSSQKAAGDGDAVG